MAWATSDVLRAARPPCRRPLSCPPSPGAARMSLGHLHHRCFPCSFPLPFLDLSLSCSLVLSTRCPPLCLYLSSSLPLSSCLPLLPSLSLSILQHFLSDSILQPPLSLDPLLCRPRPLALLRPVFPPQGPLAELITVHPPQLRRRLCGSLGRAALGRPSNQQAARSGRPVRRAPVRA